MYTRASAALFMVLAVYGGVTSAQYTAECMVEPDIALTADDELVSGTVFFTQDSENDDLFLEISLSGFNISDPNIKHGFHVHETGDISGGCGSTNGHYNPDGNNHGAPNATDRHAGDLGNVHEDTSGNVDTIKIDNVATMYGANSILGRAIVVHAQEDDLGLGGHEDSLTTGNAGARLACCIIQDTTTTANNRAAAAGVTSVSVHSVVLLFTTLAAMLYAI